MSNQKAFDFASSQTSFIRKAKTTRKDLVSLRVDAYSILTQWALEAQSRLASIGRESFLEEQERGDGIVLSDSLLAELNFAIGESYANLLVIAQAAISDMTVFDDTYLAYMNCPVDDVRWIGFRAKS